MTQTKVTIRNISAGRADIIACDAMNILNAHQASGQILIRTKAQSGKVIVILSQPNQTVISLISKIEHEC